MPVTAQGSTNPWTYLAYIFITVYLCTNYSSLT